MSNNPTCHEEVHSWYSQLKEDPNNEKAFWKLRCYLNFCLKNEKSTKIVFKECCKNNEKNIEKRLAGEGWMTKNKQQILKEAKEYLDE
jgi:hypothetical protein